MRAAAACPPTIVRVAGLPAEVMEPFRHVPVLEALAERERLEKQLAERRAALVDLLHGVIPRVAREERRFLLAVKRHCFNAGSLAAHRQDPRWPVLAQAASTLVEAVLALEEAIAAAGDHLAASYRRALAREQQSLVQLLDNRAFVRGLALASQVVAQNLDHLRGELGPGGFGRRERRLCLTLLRYVSRAALKPSPFSTLTRTGLASATGSSPGALALAPVETWRERSTISLHRELLAEWSCLLLRCRPFAERLPVMLNETLTAEGDGRYSFFRPSRWEFDDESRAFRYVEASTVRVKLEGPLIPWLTAELHEGPQVYRHLLDRSRACFDDEGFDGIESGMAQLLALGLLNLILPWDLNAPDVERQILGHLESLAGGAGLDAFRNGLRELVQRLPEYSCAGSPARFLEECRRQVEQLFLVLAPAAGVAPDVEFAATEYNFEEDVFLRPEPEEAAARGIASLSPDHVRGLLEDLDPLVRLDHLYSGAHDLLATLVAFGERRWPGAKDVGLLEFFSSAQPLFDQYIRYRGAALRNRASLPPGFNPLDLEALKSLTRWRAQVEKELDTCLREDGGVQRLCPRALGGLLDQVPGGWARSRHFCAFVQPADADGRTWVLNAVAEGYGRYSGRFTTGMDEASRAGWTSRFTRLAVFDAGGEPIELIDTSAPGKRTINVHAVQTCRVLKMPGDFSPLPADRVLRLCDLRVRLRGVEGLPVLTDAAGRRLLPVSFGGLAPWRRPTLLKFLAIFGPAEISQRHPVRPPRREDGVEVLDRHVLGQVVYARKGWRFETPPLLASLEGQDEVRAFAAVQRWRLAQGLPDRVFVKEPLASRPASRPKPQYVDFSSPTFVQIFRSILQANPQALALEESLPVPEHFPVSGSRWGVEVQLESFAWVSPPLLAQEGHSTTARAAGAIGKESLR